MWATAGGFSRTRHRPTGPVEGKDGKHGGLEDLLLQTALRPQVFEVSAQASHV